MGSNIVTPGLVLALALLGASAKAAPCRIDHARYAMAEAPGITAAFHPIKHKGDLLSDIALSIHSAKSGQTRWYFFDWGSGRYIHMIRTTDVNAPGWSPIDPNPKSDQSYRDMTYMQADRSLRFSLKGPQQGQRRPNPHSPSRSR